MPNSSGKQTPVSCSTCSKVYSSARNFRRHEQTIHRIFPNPPPPTICDEFRKSLATLAEAREHVDLNHNVTTDSLCMNCHTIFLSVEKLRQNTLKIINYPFGIPERRREHQLLQPHLLLWGSCDDTS